MKQRKRAAPINFLFFQFNSSIKCGNGGRQHLIEMRLMKREKSWFGEWRLLLSFCSLGGLWAGPGPMAPPKRANKDKKSSPSFVSLKKEKQVAQLMIGEMKLIEWLMKSIMKSMNERQSINKRPTKRPRRAASQRSANKSTKPIG